MRSQIRYQYKRQAESKISYKDHISVHAFTDMSLLTIYVFCECEGIQSLGWLNKTAIFNQLLRWDNLMYLSQSKSKNVI